MPKLKVLHIGNVANYAYNVGKVLQTAAVESHAVNWDYYHINAQPVWEEGDFDASSVGDHFFPVLPDSEKAGFSAPGWYISGPRTLACLALIATNEGMSRRARLFRWLNQRHLRKIGASAYRERDAKFGLTRLTEAVCLDLVGGFGRSNALGMIGRAASRFLASPPAVPSTASSGLVSRVVWRLRSAAHRLGWLVLGACRRLWDRLKWPMLNMVERVQRYGRRILRRLGLLPAPSLVAETAAPAAAAVKAPAPAPPACATAPPALAAASPAMGLPASQAALPSDFDARVDALIARYHGFYPDRSFDPLLLRQFKSALPLMQRLFAPYDVVIGYALEGIWPLVANRPYVAYEFGTIRNLPFEDSATGRLASLVYHHCEQTIVTNSDNQAPAERLGQPYFFLPHIVNESGLLDEGAAAAFRAELQARHGGDFFIFHPPRQHWDESRDTNWDKGNDHLFRGFADLVRSGADGARCIAVAWGQTLEKSRQLVQELGIADNVIWIEPQPHIAMMRYICACDVVCDQFTIPTFGGIPPKAFHSGKPVVTAFDPALHAWCFDEMPPLLPARSAEAVAEALRRLHGDAEFRAEVGARGADWYRRSNSNARVLAVLEQNLVGLVAPAAATSQPIRTPAA